MIKKRTLLAPEFSDNIHAQDRDGGFKAVYLKSSNRNAFDFLNPLEFCLPRNRTEALEVPSPHPPVPT